MVTELSVEVLLQAVPIYTTLQIQAKSQSDF